MLIVADSSPLISLAILDKLDLLNKIFDDFYVPAGVYFEVVSCDKPYSAILKDLLKNHLKKVSNKLALKLLSSEVDAGEAEAIILAVEHSIPVILIDDLRGRKKSQYNGLQTLGTLGLLLQAKKQGYLEKIKPSIETLLKNDIRLSKKLCERILTIAGEI